MTLKMSDKKNIVDFVQEVEKYPCLYDQTLTHYSNRTITTQAWKDIANTLQTSVPESKERWRKIRIAFMRSLKQVKSKNPPSRPYYLTDYLQFLVPFIKIPNGEPTNHQPSSSSDDDQLQIDDIQTKQEVDSESNGDEDDIQNDFNNTPKIFVANFSETNRVNQMKRRIPQNFKKRRIFSSTDSNPRKMFLLSLLPDVDGFTEQEMRVFRRVVVSSIDNIMSEREKSYIKQ